MNRPFTPIRDQRLSDQVIEQLLEGMRSGDLPVGTRLPPEGTLATELGVSRGILREALTVLEARGFIRRAPRGGTVVQSTQGDELGRALSTQMRKATYRDLLEFREVMECRAVENIVRTASDADIAELEKLLESTPEPVDPSRLDQYFHYRLAELSGNSLFSSCIHTYYELIREMARVSLQTSSRRLEIQTEHGDIVRALKARDARGARQAVRRHLDAVRQSVTEVQK